MLFDVFFFLTFIDASDAFDAGGGEEGDGFGFTPFIIFDNSSFAVDFFVFFAFFFLGRANCSRIG